MATVSVATVIEDGVDLVREFHDRFGALAHDHPKTLYKDEWRLRFDLIYEEMVEYWDACQSKQIDKIADALTDLLYVTLGSFVAHGLGSYADALFREVHRSNMAKLDKDGYPRYGQNGKVLKPKGWTPPDIKGVLGLHTTDEEVEE